MESFVGQIMLFGFGFAPDGWALCDGSLLPIAGNEALFTLIGTTYGGDGDSTFALPDLRGRIPIHMGQAPGLNGYTLGERAGSERVSLQASEMPSHMHLIEAASAESGATGTPGPTVVFGVSNAAKL